MNLLHKLERAEDGNYAFTSLFHLLGHPVTSANQRWKQIGDTYKAKSHVSGSRVPARSLTYAGVIQYLAISKELETLVELYQCQHQSTIQTMD